MIVKESIKSAAQFVRGGDDIKANIGIGREKLIGDFIADYNKTHAMNTFFKQLSMDNKSYILGAAIVSDRPDIVKLLVTDPTIDPSERRNTFLEKAAEQGNPEIMEILLSDPRVNPSDHHNLALATAVEKNNLEVVKVLLADSRVNPADAKMTLDKNFNETPDPNYIIKLAAQNNNVAVARELLKDSRVDPNKALNFAASKLNKVGVKATDWLPMVELLLNNSRTEITDAKRKSIEASIERNK